MAFSSTPEEKSVQFRELLGQHSKFGTRLFFFCQRVFVIFFRHYFPAPKMNPPFISHVLALHRALQDKQRNKSVIEYHRNGAVEWVAGPCTSSDTIGEFLFLSDRRQQ